jgi:hypothetical protein
MKTRELRKTSMMWHLKDIYLCITWSKIAEICFPDKSLGWFFNKMHGRDGNGGEGEFTYAEKMQLRNALIEFSEHVRDAAHKIDV